MMANRPLLQKHKVNQKQLIERRYQQMLWQRSLCLCRVYNCVEASLSSLSHLGNTSLTWHFPRTSTCRKWGSWQGDYRSLNHFIQLSFPSSSFFSSQVSSSGGYLQENKGNKICNCAFLKLFLTAVSLITFRSSSGIWKASLASSC